ncbi:MAG: VOC family protein [Flavobacteriales bacterium]|nr:VOC family protein [Flavobacteriales bacterium]
MKKENFEFPKMHVSLYVKDIDRTVAFYENFFAQKATKVKPGYAKFHLEKPGLVISFVENAEKVTPAFGHLGFQVQSEEELKQRLATATKTGIEVLEQLGENCCYAKQDKFWASDPDGYRWEVYYFHADMEWNDPHYAKGSEACCSPAMVTETAKEDDCCVPGSGCC